MEIKDIISSGLLEMYVTGLTTEQENTQVEFWKKQYPEVAQELSAIEKSLEAFAFAHSIPPAVDLKSKIEQSIQSEFKIQPLSSGKVYTISPYWKLLAAASVILLLVSGVLNYVYYNRLQDSIVAQENYRQELFAQNDKVEQLNQNFTVIQSKYSEPVALHGLPAAPDAAAKIFWMKNTGDVYIDASNLPEAPEGMQYQLWGIVDGKPVDGGMIIQTKKGNTYEIQKMKAFGKAEAFAVTLESEIGNTTPKGEMYVMGKM